jgi:Holliday junction DNA helicase RuvB
MTQGQRIISGSAQDDDLNLDTSLRPRRLRDYVGQELLKSNLDIAVRAAIQRSEPLDHCLLYGPPGLGKTTLANILGFEMGVRVRTTSGPAIERPGDMVAILTQLQENDILFVDEVHRLSRVVEEVLYPAMEDFFLSWVVGKGLGARNINLRINPFTLIGATTRYGMVSPPLRDRFGAIFRMDFYDLEAMYVIVKRSARILGSGIEDSGAREVASRSRGTPRVANRLLRRTRDYAQVMADGRITGEIAKEALAKLEVDNLGLDQIDHRLLDSIIGKFAGGPVGLDTVAASIGEDPDTIEEIYEPYLLQLGFLDRTPRGRLATNLAYDHLGREHIHKGRSRGQSPQGRLL